MNDLFDLFDLPDFSKLEEVEEHDYIDKELNPIRSIGDLMDYLELESLEEEDKSRIDKRVNILINEIQGDRRLISRLVLNSIPILTVKEDKLNQDNFIDHFWKKYLVLDEQVVTLSLVRYAAYSLLKQIIDGGSLSWELAITIINKLEHMQKEDEDNLDLYNNLNEYFHALSNDFEKSFYQLTGDYKCSPDFDRILLLIIEFLDQQKGNWATSDLMLLKIKLDGMGVSVDDEITIEEFYKYLIRNSSICTKLYQNLSEDGLKELDLFEAPIIKGIEKIIKLNNEERIIYDTLVQELDNAGITYKEDGIKAKLIGTYLMSDAFVDIKQEITTFNFTIELLTNLDLIWDYQKEVLSKEFKDLSLSVAEDIEYEEKEGIELELNREDNKQETLEDILKEEVIDEDMQAFTGICKEEEEFLSKIKSNAKSAKDEEENDLQEDPIEIEEKVIKRDKKKGQKLLLKVRENNLEEARVLLDEGADINVTDNRNRTALMYATQFEDIELIKMLIEAGANVNERDNRGKTALFEAISSDNVDIVKLLLDSGANPKVKYRGTNAFEIATMWNRIDIIKLLKEYFKG